MLSTSNHTLPKRVTLLHYRLDLGGIDRVACLLAKGFADAGLQCDLLVFCDKGTGEAALMPLLDANVNLHYLGQSRGSRTSDLVRLAPSAAKWIGQNKPDALLSTCNNMNWMTTITAAMARSKARIILKTTNPIIREMDSGLYAVLRKMGYNLSFRKADKILALSDSETRLLRKQFQSIGMKISTVTNPYVTPEMLNKSTGVTRNGGRKTILGVGRFEPQKQFDLLIKAFASLNRPDTDLFLLGDGQQKAEYETLIRQLNLEDRVRMPGFVDNIAEWLHRGDLLVMTSRYEGLPAVVLEALAANCPVLSTDCFPAARELLMPAPGCGIIDNPIPNQIAIKIGAMLAQPAPKQLPEIAKKYSIENGVDDHIRQVSRLI